MTTNEYKAACQDVAILLFDALNGPERFAKIYANMVVEAIANIADQSGFDAENVHDDVVWYEHLYEETIEQEA